MYLRPYRRTFTFILPAKLNSEKKTKCFEPQKKNNNWTPNDFFWPLIKFFFDIKKKIDPPAKFFLGPQKKLDSPPKNLTPPP